MRVLLLITTLFIISFNNIAQTYNMANGSDTTCTGTFLDNGGTGLYTANQNLTKTFCSNTPGSVVSVTFTSFMTEASFDELCIYDGASTSATLIGCYSGTGTLNGKTFTSSTGCLTFNFTSNGSTHLNGWSANISCKFSCQTINGVVSSILPTPDTSALKVIKLCKGDIVNFSGSATFPQSGTYYTQSVSSSSFKWKTGDGFVINGATGNHTFNTSGTFDVNLVVTDSLGCESFTHAARVVISETPKFIGVNYLPNDTICFGDSNIVQINSLFVPFTPPSLQAGDTTFLPDGTGVAYSDTININVFDPTATYQANFLNKIFIDIEHSYLGDLEIRLICPNNQSVVLKQYPGALGTFLGEPVDPPVAPSPLDPGVGYIYNFPTTTPVYNTMVNEAGKYRYNYTDVLGYTYANQFYLPAGDYTSFQNINTQLIGCPLNGNWVIRVTDNVSIDDGYIFKWGLDFDSLIRPPSTITTILPVKDSSWWTSSSFSWMTLNDSTIGTNPLTPGTHQYTYHIRDNFGCTHDTTVDVFVHNKPKSNAGTDFTTCLLSYQLSPVATPLATSSNWTYYASTGTANSVLANSATYNTNTTVNEYVTYNYILSEIVNGCPTYPDTVEIIHVQLQNTIDISVDDDSICLPQMVTFTNNSDMTYYDSVYWEFGDGNSSNTQGTASYSYAYDSCFDLKVTLVNTLGCKVDSVIEDIVCAFRTPIADFFYNPLVPVVPNTRVDFTNTSLYYTNSLWRFSNLGYSFLQDPYFEFPKTEGGDYPVTLMVINEGGCIDSITRIINIKNTLNIFIPNSFTPNSDGVNDKFFVHFNNESVEKYTVHIFNRWGELMFTSHELDFEWDGTYNGELAPEGVYIWKITGKDIFFDKVFDKTGHIMLIR